ncbi:MULTISPECIES: HD-GYP domain-containing protein [unclassified Vibrio]|uniref:HD-GYP domain-containing protein n=1 Tax=Vibrio sp. HB236076 TaxID=3232307 RepID=A0AB39HDS5_9VIBR|nr:HD-GYP domain-containing protein [Vibrio sp. HB161653]MDP5255343.1 HD-GYP domain-containing protein [Vibrio sp. HB161653]
MAGIKILTDRLCVGLHIRLPLKWNEHPFILNSFKIKSDEQIAILRHLGLKYVFFNPAQSDVDPLPSSSIDTTGEKPPFGNALGLSEQMWQEKQRRIEKLSAYRRRVSQCEKEFSRSIARMRSAMQKMKHRPQDGIAEAQSLAADIVEQLDVEGNLTLHLINHHIDTDDIFFHSLNVCVVSLLIGRAKQYQKEQLQTLCLAALFHDVGKMKIPTAILRKEEDLTEPELNYLKLHVKYGVEMSKEIDAFPTQAMRVIDQHHELLDGSGYPKGLTADEIDEMTQIVAVANIFDNLCHSINVNKRKIPYTALSHLYKHCTEQYNLENIKVMIKFMGVYPPGTLVQLSNQMLGVVISVNSQHILAPNVLIYDPDVPREQAPVIDLSEKDIKIVSAVLPSKVPATILAYLNPRGTSSYFFDQSD